MAKKTKKPVSNTTARDVRSRRGKMPPETRTFSIDKLGKVITWNVPQAPYTNDEDLRMAFVGGFESRVRQVNSPLEEKEYGVEQRFEIIDLQKAFEDGYNEAATQDGLHRKAVGLFAMSSKTKAKK